MAEMIEHFTKNAPFYIALFVIGAFSISAFTGRQLEITKSGLKFGSSKKETSDLKSDLKIVLKVLLNEHKRTVEKELTIKNNKEDFEKLKNYVLRNIEELLAELNDYFIDNILEKQRQHDRRKVNYICDYWEAYVLNAKANAVRFSMKRIEENGFDGMDEGEFFKYKQTTKKNMIEEMKKHSKIYNRVHRYLNMYFIDEKYDEYEVRSKYEKDMEALYEKLEPKFDEILNTIRNEMLEIYNIKNKKLETIQTEWETTYSLAMEQI